MLNPFSYYFQQRFGYMLLVKYKLLDMDFISHSPLSRSPLTLERASRAQIYIATVSTDTDFSHVL